MLTSTSSTLNVYQTTQQGHTLNGVQTMKPLFKGKVDMLKIFYRGKASDLVVVESRAALSNNVLTFSHLFINKKGLLGAERTLFNSIFDIALFVKVAATAPINPTKAGVSSNCINANIDLFKRYELLRNLFSLSTRDGLILFDTWAPTHNLVTTENNKNTVIPYTVRALE